MSSHPPTARSLIPLPNYRFTSLVLITRTLYGGVPNNHLFARWRRGRDSNPRWVSPHTPLAGERLQPLGHLSNVLGLLARLTGFEPVIASFVDWCLIQFGHRRNTSSTARARDFFCRQENSRIPSFHYLDLEFSCLL